MRSRRSTRSHARVLQRAMNSSVSAPANTGSAQPVSVHVEIVADLDLELAAVERDGHAGSTRRGSDRGDGGADAPVPEDSVSPTPRSKIRARTPCVGVDADERRRSCGSGTARCARSAGRAPPGRAARARRRASITHCGLPMLTCWNSSLRPAAVDRAAPVRRAAGGKSAEPGCARPMSTRARAVGGDRRADRARRRSRSRTVRVGPALAAQVEDRLPRAVAGQLGLGAVGIEDPQRRRRSAASDGRRQQQHAVRAARRSAARRCRRTRSGVSSNGSVVALDDQVVVAERLPLLERQCSWRRGRLSSRSSDRLGAPRGRRAPVRSIDSTPASFRIQVSWRLT